MTGNNIMKKHIMVVDDSKTIRNLVAFVLKGEGLGSALPRTAWMPLKSSTAWTLLT